ncbi:MAG: 30S ribosomal protein S12 methylthiotransferase RimO, partial [Chloroflexi bacterium]|nr:30S ribosomal protein S12 methylthiotransferase RimO [Chloroflexota bacterium]
MEQISFHVITLGCDKNSVDSEGMSQLLLGQGYSLADRIDDAGVVIVNTCGFIELARRESLQALRSAAGRKRKGQLLIAAGCLVERDRDKIRQEIPAIDGLIGTRELANLGVLLEKLGGWP